MIDLGCGDGSITLAFKEKLDVKNVFGVDIDEEAISVARQRGIVAENLDLSEDKLPFLDGFFDLAISFEVIEHLTNPDNMLEEVHRVLRKGGMFLISTPNLASWFNRLALLFGFQPYNVEVSTKIAAGVPYGEGVFEKPSGHIRAFTPKALKRLLEHHGFQTIKIMGAPGVNPRNRFFRQLDKLFSLRAPLARRLIVLAEK